MQVQQTYSGTLESASENITRPYSYGMTATMQLNAAKTELLNQTVAGFLSENCGVEAAYEDRDASGQKWLWIFGCPFLFACPASANTRADIYGPFSTVSLTADVVLTAFSGNGYYLILRFFGDPSRAFSLVALGYSSSQLKNGFKVVKSRNILNGRKALFYALGDRVTNTSSSSSQPAPPPMVAGARCVDFDEAGAVVAASIGENMPYMPLLDTTAQMYNANSDKIPLVPIRVNLWELEGCYCYPRNWGLPAAYNMAVQTQAEFEVGGRRFITTTPDSGGLSNFINLGLLEVTEAPASGGETA